jgi:hypothetical protein
MRIPPPTSNSSPVTQPESSEARKRAALAAVRVGPAFWTSGRQPLPWDYFRVARDSGATNRPRLPRTTEPSLDIYGRCRKRKCLGRMYFQRWQEQIEQQILCSGG